MTSEDAPSNPDEGPHPDRGVLALFLSWQRGPGKPGTTKKSWFFAQR